MIENQNDGAIVEFKMPEDILEEEEYEDVEDDGEHGHNDFDVFSEIFLLLKDFYITYVISEMHRQFIIDEEKYNDYLNHRIRQILPSYDEERGEQHGGSGQGQDESTSND